MECSGTTSTSEPGGIAASTAVLASWHGTPTCGSGSASEPAVRGAQGSTPGCGKLGRAVDAGSRDGRAPAPHVRKRAAAAFRPAGPSFPRTSSGQADLAGMPVSMGSTKRRASGCRRGQRQREGRVGEGGAAGGRRGGLRRGQRRRRAAQRPPRCLQAWREGRAGAGARQKAAVKAFRQMAASPGPGRRLPRPPAPWRPAPAAAAGAWRAVAEDAAPGLGVCKGEGSALCGRGRELAERSSNCARAGEYSLHESRPACCAASTCPAGPPLRSAPLSHAIASLPGPTAASAPPATTPRPPTDAARPWQPPRRPASSWCCSCRARSGAASRSCGCSTPPPVRRAAGGREAGRRSTAAGCACTAAALCCPCCTA